MFNNNYYKIIDVYKDYSYIMYIICEKTASYYYNIKNIINIPIIISSTSLTIINSTTIENENLLKIISIVCNLIIALSIAFLNLFKIPEKENSFKMNSQSFFQLYNKIAAEIAKSKTTMNEINAMKYIDEYNLLTEQIVFHIPAYIKNDILKKFNNYNIPAILESNRKKNKKIKYDDDSYRSTIFQHIKNGMGTFETEITLNNITIDNNNLNDIEILPVKSKKTSPLNSIVIDKKYLNIEINNNTSNINNSSGNNSSHYNSPCNNSSGNDSTHNNSSGNDSTHNNSSGNDSYKTALSYIK